MSDQTPRRRKADAHEDEVDRAVRFLKWLVVVLIVISAGNFARSFVNQNATEDAEAAARQAVVAAASILATTEEARDSSRDTLAELRAVIARSEQQSGSSEAVTEALRSIDRIEHKLCGGKCPES